MSKEQKKHPGDEQDKPQHTGEHQAGRKSQIKNEGTGDTAIPNAFYSKKQ